MSWHLTDVLGQDTTLDRLRRECAAGRMSHAYMFEGAPGLGKTTLARGLAAALLCQSPVAPWDACGQCRSCLLLAHNNHPDYLELPREPAELRIGRFVERPGGTETVEHTPLLPFLRLRPVEGGRRVAVVPDAERMRQEAANAFLKTLEEPPGDTVLILTVNARDRLPATVASRCRRFGVAPLEPGLLAREAARREQLPEEEALALALAAEGSLGQALGLIGGETVSFWRWLEEEGLANLAGPEAGKRLADALQSFVEQGGDNAGKRRGALRALDLTALAVRRRLRRGLDPMAGEKALAALWMAADQVVRNVRPELALLSAADTVAAALSGAEVR